MKVSAVVFSLILTSSASAQKGVAQQRLRYRLLKAEKEQGKQSKEDEPVSAEKPVPLSSATSMSMSAPFGLADPAFPQWDADLAQFAFDASVSLSMSMAPLSAEKCDKKCQKEKLGRRHPRMEGKADKEPVEPEDDDIEPLSAVSSLSLSVNFGAWAEPDLELFGFEAFESSMSFSLPQESGSVMPEKKRSAITTDSSLSLSVDFEAWAESDLIDFGFDTFDASSMSLSMSTP